MDSRVTDGIHRFEGTREPDWLQVLLSPVVADMVAARAEARREVVLAYLRQEGLTDGVPWGLVDLGWNGRLQSSLKSLIGSELRHPIKGFYFALFKRPTGVGELEAYFCDWQAGLGLLKSPLHAAMMEMFCTAPHGIDDWLRRTRRSGRTGIRRGRGATSCSGVWTSFTGRPWNSPAT